MGFWFGDVDDGQRIMDSVVSFIEAVDGSIGGGGVNGDLAAIGNAFDGRGSNNVNLTVDEDSSTDGTWNRRRRTNIETKVPEVMLGLKFNICGTTEYIKSAEDGEESDSAEIRFGLKVSFISCDGRIGVGRFKVNRIE